MLQIAICDDDIYVCSELEKIIIVYSKLNQKKIEIEIFTKGEELLKFIKNQHKFDLIFLDIELNTTTGIIVGNEIRNIIDDHVSKIVFITAKDGYQNDLFDMQPFNFIKKPIEHTKVEKCIDLAIKLCVTNRDIFEFKKGYDIVKYELREIVFFEKIGRKINIVTDTDSNLFYDTLNKVKEKLPDYFIQPHSSFLVNFEKISRTTKDSIIMSNKKEIPISQRNLKHIRELLLNSERIKKDGII